MHHTEIVNAVMCELPAACNFADCPNAGRGRLKSLVDLDISTVGLLDPGQLQSKSFGIRSAARRDQHMAVLEYHLSSILLGDDVHRVSRFS